MMTSAGCEVTTFRPLSPLVLLSPFGLGRENNRSHRRILVVDDEPEAREIIAAHLAGQPVRIETAANGREALAVLEKTPVQLVVLDLVMPIMDGLAFLETLRTDSRHQQLPVVVVTSRSLSPAEKEQLRRQTLAFVKKTDLSEESFKRLLQRVLEEAENHRGKNAAPGQAVIG